MGKSGHVKAFTLGEIYKTCLAGVPNNLKNKSPSELVGGLEHFLFFHILGTIIPTD